MSAQVPSLSVHRPRTLKLIVRLAKRIVPLVLAIIFIPKILLFFVVCGLLDVCRNQHRTLETIDRYFAGNGIFTWLLSPFNLLLDLLSLPYLNKGIYKLSDLPKGYQEEIESVIRTAHERNLVGELQAKLGDKPRAMMFFKWYGKNVDASVPVPEYHQAFKYVQTIGVSVFNKKASTGKHYGPLRVTLRVLYNINTINDRAVYIQVGNQTHYWQDEKLFIFDDTLQHQSCNGSDAARYCLFVDILRPSLIPSVHGVILACLRFVFARFNYVFFKNWTFLK